MRSYKKVEFRGAVSALIIVPVMVFRAANMIPYTRTTYFLLLTVVAFVSSLRSWLL